MTPIAAEIRALIDHDEISESEFRRRPRNRVQAPPTNYEGRRKSLKHFLVWYQARREPRALRLLWKHGEDAVREWYDWLRPEGWFWEGLDPPVGFQHRLFRHIKNVGEALFEGMRNPWIEVVVDGWNLAVLMHRDHV